MTEKTKAAKRTVKDSVFTDLFKDKKYLLRLYQALHPEDRTATEESLSDITINNVLVDGQYNDLGFMVNGKLMILTEAQSTWSVNILVRTLFYFAQSLQEHLDREGADLYGSRKVQLPESELYVIYTGDRADHPHELSLIEQFFKENEHFAVDVKAKMLYGTVDPDKTEGEDIIGQYVLFTKVYDEQRRKYGRTAKAVAETIRICKDRDILKEYLASREKEVTTMMMDLYDQDRILEIHIASEKKIAAEEAAEKAAKEAAEKAAKEAAKAEKKRIATLVESINNLKKNMGWTSEKAMEILGLSESDRKAAAPFL